VAAIMLGSFGGACGEARPKALAVSPDDGVYVVGQFTTRLDVCEWVLMTDGRPSAFVFKLNSATGATVWAKK
jgi:hypothetical protein